MTITTVSASQTEILRNIMTLYNDGQPFEADVSYGSGAFYKDIKAPAYRFDIEPRYGAVTQADVRHLPVPDDRYASVVFDPPFIHAPGKDSIMGRRFGGYPSQKALREMYEQAVDEIHRVLTPGGLLVFKCQDIIESGKQNMNHCHVWLMAGVAGFRTEDLFILTRKAAIEGWNHKVQQHARKTHSYFWVFRKEGKP